jgi:hypothetical protein
MPGLAAPSAATKPLVAPPAPGAPAIPAAAPTKPLQAPSLTKPAAATLPPPANTIALPKATVQLAAPTKPLGTGGVSATQKATLAISDDEDESPEDDTMTTVLSIFGFVAACGVLVFQCLSIGIWDGWSELL